jgi:hypothetical protein
MGIVEVIILMIVLGIALWGIMSTVAWSTELQTFARISIDARILASSWFEVFESVNPEPLDASFTMQSASDYVAEVLYPGGNKAYPNYVIHGFRVNVNETSLANGVRSVRLRILAGGDVKRKNPIVVSRQINARSSETVSDDRWGG